jgi:hypothetical protein
MPLICAQKLNGECTEEECLHSFPHEIGYWCQEEPKQEDLGNFIAHYPCAICIEIFDPKKKMSRYDILKNKSL